MLSEALASANLVLFGEPGRLRKPVFRRSPLRTEELQLADVTRRDMKGLKYNSNVGIHAVTRIPVGDSNRSVT